MDVCQWSNPPIAFRWLTTLSALLFIVFGLTGNLGAPGFADKMTAAGNVAYISLSRAGWGLILAWVVIACSTKQSPLVNGYGGELCLLLSSHSPAS